MPNEYKGQNTVDWNESAEITARGSLMRMVYHKYVGHTRSEVETQAGRITSRRLIFDPRVVAVREKLVAALRRMPRRETP